MLMSSAGNLGCQVTPQPRGAEIDRRGLGRTAALQLVELRIESGEEVRKKFEKKRFNHAVDRRNRTS